MDIQPRHTKIEKTIQTSYGTVVMEHYSGFPRSESNIYCVGPGGTVLWFAEKPDPYTLYSRLRFNEDGWTLSTYTINGHACDLDMETGKILNKTSIQ
ncbi:MAG: hypothetical protein Kow0070_20930 [Anaerolineales bacterium]